MWASLLVGISSGYGSGPDGTHGTYGTNVTDADAPPSS